MPVLRIKERGYRVLREERSKLHTFDQKSGLQYTETVLRAAPMRADWVWKARGCTTEIALFRASGPGCSTLQDMAIRKACLHVVSITPDSLVGLDWQVGKGLWERIVALQIDSLYAWRLFAAVYSGETDKSLNQRYQIMPEPNMEFASYIKQINSPLFQWITFLSLSHMTCSYIDLINISKLSNLGALTIGHGVETSADKGLDDSVVRAWSRAAIEGASFSRLQVFACRKQKLLTAQVFQHLTSCPALTLFLVEECSIGPGTKSHAQGLGWNYSSGKDLNEVLIQSGATSTSWDSLMHACFQKASDISQATTKQSCTQSPKNLSVLHFAIGGVPTDAVIEGTGNRSLRCFHRGIPHYPEQAASQAPSKRPLHDLSNTQPATKRIARTMRKVHATNFMNEFGF